MFGGIAIGIGLAIVFLSNQGASGNSPPPGNGFLQQENLFLINQENGFHILLN